MEELEKNKEMTAGEVERVFVEIMAFGAQLFSL